MHVVDCDTRVRKLTGTCWAPQRHEVQPDVYCRRLSLQVPIAVSVKTGQTADVFHAICRVAMNPCVPPSPIRACCGALWTMPPRVLTRPSPPSRTQELRYSRRRGSRAVCSSAVAAVPQGRVDGRWTVRRAVPRLQDVREARRRGHGWTVECRTVACVPVREWAARAVVLGVVGSRCYSGCVSVLDDLVYDRADMHAGRPRRGVAFECGREGGRSLWTRR